MNNWIRKVVPDLFLAALVALLVTLAVHYLEGSERRRMQSDFETAARDGVTLDDRIEVFDGSIRRSTLFHLPLLAAISGIVVGLGCRNRGWAWLTAFGAILPALIMGVAFFVDHLLPASLVVGVYSAITIVTAWMAVAVRNRLVPAPIPKDS
jgi:hypothetical protein